jgi:nicotinamidase-related amidase
MEGKMKPALLVIDIQKQFYKISDETTHSLQDAVEYTNEASARNNHR